MLDQQAELHATEPLEALADAIAGLAGQVAGQLEDTEAEFMPRFRRLRRAQQAAREAVRAAEEAVARADEADERRAAEAWLEDAEEAQHRLDAAMDDVQSALGRYKAEARELDGARRGIFPEAARHLQTLVANAKAYSAVAVPSGTGGGGAAGGEDTAAPPTGPEPNLNEQIAALNAAIGDLVGRSGDQAKELAEHYDQKMTSGDMFDDFRRFEEICACTANTTDTGTIYFEFMDLKFAMYAKEDVGVLTVMNQGSIIRGKPEVFKFRYDL